MSFVLAKPMLRIEKNHLKKEIYFDNHYPKWKNVNRIMLLG